jgi:hypothetical protein
MSVIDVIRNSRIFGPVHTVIETPAYLAAAKRAGMPSKVMVDVVTALAADPMLGDLLEGTGGFRKFRFARPGEGKSGGYRIVSFYHSKSVPVFLVTVFEKSQKDNLTQAERNGLAKVADAIGAAFSQPNNRTRR